MQRTKGLMDSTIALRGGDSPHGRGTLYPEERLILIERVLFSRTP